MKTNLERQNEFNERKLAAGYVKIQFYAKEENKKLILDFVKKLEVKK